MKHQARDSDEILLSILLDSSPDPLFVTTGKHFVYVNKSGASILHAESPESLVGKSLESMISSHSPRELIQVLKDEMDGKPAKEKYDISIPLGDNKFTYFEANVRVVDYDGTTAVLTFMRDVTQLKQYQKCLEGLNKNAVALGSAETIEEIADITRNSLIDVIGLQRGSLGFVENNNLVYRYHTGFRSNNELIMPLDGPGVSVQVVITGETAFIPDTRLNIHFIQPTDYVVTLSEMLVPVKVSGEVVAVITTGDF